ncbi:MAG TPA: GTPase HflX [Gemmatimonadales bacterium]|nr:GTPase HflX [Gemmatimonadales bacterium]
MAAPRKGSRDVSLIDEHLAELARLVDTAGAVVVGRVTQQVQSPTPAFYIGEGKVEEVREAVKNLGATLVIFDDELSPTQGANLERELQVRVMDRAEVILDIFSTRARSHEAKLQVELAQLEYLLPRLMRMWTHLSRIRGGIGLRGPGETQLETDRRMIRRKIQLLREKLRGVERHRATVRSGREPMLDVALVGYTNAGKSSILRSLSGEHDIFVENRLFATLDTLTRVVDIGEGYKARLTDTVGFIRKLPHQLVASFRATLEEAREADLLLHVVDASDPEFEDQMQVVDEVLEELELDEQPIVPVFNKIDLLVDPVGFAARMRTTHPGAIMGTTVRTDGMVALKTALRERARREKPMVTLRVPTQDGARLAEVYRLGEVVSRRTVDEHEELTVRLEGWQAERLAREGVTIVPPATPARRATG